MNRYNLCKTLGALPLAGGLVDQDADFVIFAGVFAAAESEHYDSLNAG
jgi:hypothetical protein